MPRITVAEKLVRCWWLTSVGQQVSQWLPAGEYEAGPTVELRGHPTVALVNAKGFAYHVSGSWLNLLSLQGS